MSAGSLSGSELTRVKPAVVFFFFFLFLQTIHFKVQLILCSKLAFFTPMLQGMDIWFTAMLPSTSLTKVSDLVLYWGDFLPIELLHICYLLPILSPFHDIIPKFQLPLPCQAPTNIYTVICCHIIGGVDICMCLLSSMTYLMMQVLNSICRTSPAILSLVLKVIAWICVPNFPKSVSFKKNRINLTGSQ